MEPITEILLVVGVYAQVGILAYQTFKRLRKATELTEAAEQHITLSSDTEGLA